jgi:PAS domain S-box-containing protein
MGKGSLFLLYHSLAEIFSIVIAFAIFVIAWNSRRFIENSYLLFIGISFLFVGVIDLVHMLAYKGMGVFTGYDATLSSQLWIAARYMQAFAFLSAPLLLHRKLNHRLVFVSFGIATAALLYSILAAKVFPVCFIEGTGLTLFKIFSEYVIILMFAVSALLLFRRRDMFEKSILQYLIPAIIVTIFSEVAFTFYRDVYDFFNLIGHILKIVAFYLIYRAIIRIGLEKPQEIIFRELKLSGAALEREVAERTAALTQSNEYNRTLFESSPVGLVLCRIDGSLIDVNDAYARIIGRTVDETLKLTYWEITPENYADQEAQQLESLMTTGHYGAYEKEYIHKDGHLVPVLLRGLLIERGGEQYIWSSVENITERKQAADEIRKLNRDLEQRVKDRTAELEANIAEIKRMNKLFVGRELRMVELKEKIKELERKLGVRSP